jgi:CIC family chloride channel protein
MEKLPLGIAGSSFSALRKLAPLSILVGVIAGFGAVAFHMLGQAIVHFTLDLIGGYRPLSPLGEQGAHGFFEPTGAPLRPWLLMLVPIIGGLISGWLVYTFAPEAEGHGTDAAIKAYHKNRGRIRPRVPLIKMVASALTIGTGGSGGREGPIAQIGAGFGSFLGDKLKLPDHQRRIIMAAGLGAGVGAIFRAPLAGAIFASEVLYSDPDFEAEPLIPAFFSSIAAYCVYSMVYGFGPLFGVASMKFDNPMLLVPLGFLAALMSLASLLYVKCFYGVTALFKRLGVPQKLKPAIGAVLTGGVGVGLFFAMAGAGEDAQRGVLSVLSFGYGILQNTFDGKMPLTATIAVLLLVVGLGKILTTSLTIGSGGSGGVFGPSMVIGGCLGGAVGIFFHYLMPNMVTSIDMFVIMGMAAFFTAAANTPVSTLIIVLEMTAGFKLLLPAMWVCGLAYVLSRGWSIYREQLPCRAHSPAHEHEFFADVLAGLKVCDVLGPGRKCATILPTTSLEELASLLSSTRQMSFPVVDEDGRYLGIVCTQDVREFLHNDAAQSAAIAHDLLRQAPALSPNDCLGESMRQMSRDGIEELPVFDASGCGLPIGLLRRQDILAAYSKRMKQPEKV